MRDGTYVSLTPFRLGGAGPDGGQTNNNNNKFLEGALSVARYTVGVSLVSQQVLF